MKLGQSYKYFYTLGKIYKSILNQENNVLLDHENHSNLEVCLQASLEDKLSFTAQRYAIVRLNAKVLAHSNLHHLTRVTGTLNKRKVYKVSRYECRWSCNTSVGRARIIHFWNGNSFFQKIDYSCCCQGRKVGLI